MTLKPIETIAIAKAVKESAEKEARSKLEVGHYDVDVTVRIHGPILVAGCVPTTIKETVPAETLVGLLLQQLPAGARTKASRSLDRQLAAWRDSSKDLPPVEHDSAEAAERLIASGRRERAGTKNGNVTAPLTVELLRRSAKCPA